MSMMMQDLSLPVPQERPHRSIQDWMASVNTRAPQGANPFQGASDNMKMGLSFLRQKEAADEAAKRDAMIKALMGPQQPAGQPEMIFPPSPAMFGPATGA